MRRRDLFPLLSAFAGAWPLAARMQQKVMPVIGYLSSGSPNTDTFSAAQAAFLDGLSEKGYADGQNVVIEYCLAEGRLDRLPALAAELVSRKVDVIVSAGGTTGALAAKGATSTIPIVFISGDNPVERGLVASLARPGGNLTGVTTLGVTLMGKRVELISELVPRVKVIALISNPNNVNASV
jgi:putative ABC transport system substrate-binding protein